MNKDDHYYKVIENLKSSKPTLTDREELIDRIMNKIHVKGERMSIQKIVSQYLFGWAEVKWIRGAMALAATLFIGIFIIQQVVITDRINSLEKQLVKTVNTLQPQEPDLGIMQKVFLNVVAKDQMADDSITVSRSDLEELLNSYLELKKDLDELKENRRVESYIQKKIRENIEKGNNDQKL